MCVTSWYVYICFGFDGGHFVSFIDKRSAVMGKWFIFYSFGTQFLQILKSLPTLAHLPVSMGDDRIVKYLGQVSFWVGYLDNYFLVNNNRSACDACMGDNNFI